MPQENDLKRARALKKTEGEREICREKDAEIQLLKEEISELTEVVRGQEREIQKYSVFQKFMTDVIECADEVIIHKRLSYNYHPLSPSPPPPLSPPLLLLSLMRQEKSLLATTLSARPERPVHISSCVTIASTAEPLHLHCRTWLRESTSTKMP